MISKFSKYRAKVGESPIYDHRTNTLLWVDATGKKILRRNLDEELEQSTDCPDLISSIQLTERTGALVGTMMHRFCRINLETGKFEALGEVEKDLERNRFNDGKCDSVGRYWAGTMNIDSVYPNPGIPTASLYVLDLDKRIRKTLGGLSISNGLAWSKDNRAMYLVDTPVKKVFQFDFDLKAGEIRNQRVCIDFKDEEGRPDGVTIDTEGMLWIAHARAAKLSRWDSKNGRKVSEFLLPTKGTTSVIFGGKKLDTLYVTSASDLASDDAAGYVYVLEEIGATGFESNICKV
ncbi:MAG: SMP-30/gluconolactonase/LRE family protein [Nitrososphaerales archaeon]